MTDQLPSKELFPGEPTTPWDRKDFAGPPLNEAAWNYELRSYYERWQRGARDEIENLRRENVRWENAHKILLAENERLRKECMERFDQARHFAELSSGKITPDTVFACIGCGASVSGPNAYCSACFLKARAEQRATSEPPAAPPWNSPDGGSAVTCDPRDFSIRMRFEREHEYQQMCALIEGSAQPPGDGQG